MRKVKILIVSLLLLVAGQLLTSCEPDTYSLGDKLEESEIDFEIVQDFNVDPGGNTVILTNKTPGTILTWDYGTGKSNKATETIQYAFQGDYVIKISAVTAGGIVEFDPITITVTEDNLNYVNDPLWTALSNGVGNSKTWLLDLDENGLSKYFAGPQYFYGTDNGWLLGGNSWDGGDTGCYGDDCWNWSPDWAGNQWLMDAEDFGSMTFSLDGGPYVTTNNLSTDTLEEGTYFLDKDAHILTFTNATMLHNVGTDACVDNWGNAKILSLTEDTMQLGVIRRDDCDGSALLVYNFISKDYSDNWVAEDLPEPEPIVDLNGETLDDILSVTSSKTWALSPDSPFDWTDLEGNLLNGWEAATDYPDWAGYSAADQAAVAANKITFSSDGTIKTIDNNSVETEGNYSINDNNVISFSGITPSFNMGAWAVATTTSQNEWKVVKTAVTGSVVTDIWFGKRDETGKDEYMVFHFVLDNSSTAPDPDAEAKAILTANTWKLDSNRTYDVATSYGALQGPIVFSDFATWAWNPLPGEHYAAGDAGVDYGSMTFNEDGTLVVNQLTDSGSVTLNGNWSIEDGELSITTDLLHPWTIDGFVVDWTNIQTFKIESGALLLQALRDPDLSGEDEFWITWIYVPEI